MRSQLSKQSIQRNRTGALMRLGKGRFSNRLYCGVYVGCAVLPGSDGRCGPTRGPQCSACVSAQRSTNPLMPRNRAGQIMELSGGLMYCGRYLGRRAIPGSDGFCGPTYGPQCADCQAGPVHDDNDQHLSSRLIARQQVQRNSTGALIHPEMEGCPNRLYCGAHAGSAVLPGSDGRCGPTRGPQCSACVSAQRSTNPLMPRNRAGQIMELSGGLMYCGRYLGRRAIPGSDGFCGPTYGPQCADCQAGHVCNNNNCSLPSRLIARQQVQRNSTGALIHPEMEGCPNRLYCGAHAGSAVLPGSDGRCGPTRGLQCSECITVRHRSNPIVPRNRAGQKMEHSGGLMYCGRYLGRRAIPGSDGYCGPIDGPQCADCQASSRTAAFAPAPAPHLQFPSPQKSIVPAPVPCHSASLHGVGNIQNPNIHEELENVKRENTCKICLDKQINSVLIPCGHLACCMRCAKELRSKECPVCRASIVSIVEIFRT